MSTDSSMKRSSEPRKQAAKRTTEDIIDSDHNRTMLHYVTPERTRRPDTTRLFCPSNSSSGGLGFSAEIKTESSRTALQSSVAPTPSRPVPHRSGLESQCPTRQPSHSKLQRYDPRYPGLLLQPDSRPISQEQLASEVKSIYAGLTMVETKCIHVDRAQAAAAADNTDANHKLASDHWQALIALHRTLLHEHHDFFLASQHPSASPALRRLAAKYATPARMWKHGIHSFLESLRRRLPDSIDYMLAFIYLAYQMMALLYETVPAFEDTWIECLSDLGRYRMAIGDEDTRDLEIWAGITRSCYSKAAVQNPIVGRLYHHLAILCRPNALERQFRFTHSLDQIGLIRCASESILTLLDSSRGSTIADTGCCHCRTDDDGSQEALFAALEKVAPSVPPPPGADFPSAQEQDSIASYVKSKCIRWWTSVKGDVCRTIERLEPYLHDPKAQQSRLSKLISVSLKSHGKTVATFLYVAGRPVAYASSASDAATTPVRDRAPMFRFQRPYDFGVLGFMSIYWLTAFWLRVMTAYHTTAFNVAYGLTTGTGILSFIVNRDEFADPIRATVLEIWFTTTLHVGFQYCYNNWNPTLHTMSFVGLLIPPGGVLLYYPALGPLEVLPPYASLVSLLAMALYELRKPESPREPVIDEEHGHGAIALVDRAPATSQDARTHGDHESRAIDTCESLCRRAQDLPRDTFSQPTVVIDSEDTTDTASPRGSS